MKNCRKILASIGCLFLLAGCGSAKEAYNGNYTVTNEAVSGTAGAVSDYSYESDSSSKQEYTDSGSYEIDSSLSSDKLIYTGRISVETKTYPETVSFVRDRLNEYGGIVEYEYEYRNRYSYYSDSSDDGERTLEMTLRIPTEHFSTFLSDMDGNCKVTSRTTSVENITRQYNDLSIQIETEEIQLKKLQEMMEKAETIDEMIAVESRLTEVQYDLNRMKSRLSEMDTDVAYSTLTITLNEVKLYTETSESFSTEVSETFIKGMHSFITFGRNLILGIIYVFPYLILLGIAIFIFRKTGKKITFPRFRRKKKDIE